jgi:syntaxin-binding protein 1
MVESSRNQTIFSLRRNSQERVISMFDEVRSKSKGALCFLLVVDQKTLRFVSSYLKMMELMEKGVTAIEKLELKRKKFPKMNAIYFLTPTQTSINLLIEDYNNKKDPQYGQVHLFFSNKLAPEFMQQIGTCAGLVSRISNFKEFNLDYLCSEDNVFSCDLPEALPILYSKRNTAEGEKMIEDIANKLCTVIPSFQKFYEVEIAYNVTDNSISKGIASKLEKKIMEYFEKLEKQKREAEDKESPLDVESGKITFVILDRSVDPLTPVLHDFFYQPMIYDLLQIKNDVVEYEEEDKKSGKLQSKKALLTDNDDLFQRYKYCHIAEVLDGIPNEFQTFIKNNSTAKLQQGQLSNLDLNAISNIVKTMPQYNELLSKYTMHMKLIEKCWQVILI